MRWTPAARSMLVRACGRTCHGVRPSRVVLASRCRCPRGGARERLVAHGDQKARRTGEHAKQPLRPSAQGGPGCPSRTCGTCRLHFFLQAGHGGGRLPAFPAPLCFQGADEVQSSGVIRRENAVFCLAGAIAHDVDERRHAGLMVRDAPPSRPNAWRAWVHGAPHHEGIEHGGLDEESLGFHHTFSPRPEEPAAGGRLEGRPGALPVVTLHAG